MSKRLNFFLLGIIISFIVRAETTTGVFVAGMGIGNYIYNFGEVTPPQLEYANNSQTQHGSSLIRSLVVLNASYAYAISQNNDFVYFQNQ